MTLLYRVPVTFTELGACTVDGFDSCWIRDADFTVCRAHKLSVLLVQRDHGRMHVTCHRVFRHP